MINIAVITIAALASLWLMMRGHYWPAGLVALIAIVKVLP